jgi:hypothetical protein
MFLLCKIYKHLDLLQSVNDTICVHIILYIYKRKTEIPIWHNINYVHFTTNIVTCGMMNNIIEVVTNNKYKCNLILIMNKYLFSRLLILAVIRLLHIQPIKCSVRSWQDSSSPSSCCCSGNSNYQLNIPFSVIQMRPEGWYLSGDI